MEAAMGNEADLVAPRFARGCRCFAVIVDDGVAGYGWLSTGPEWIGELQLEIHPRSGEGYLWNCATILEHRRTGIFRSLLVGIAEIARRDGLQRLWIGSLLQDGSVRRPARHARDRSWRPPERGRRGRPGHGARLAPAAVALTPSLERGQINGP